MDFRGAPSAVAWGAGLKHSERSPLGAMGAAAGFRIRYLRGTPPAIGRVSAEGLVEVPKSPSVPRPTLLYHIRGKSLEVVAPPHLT
jgi:hypothetical protein